jgi:hypothetical protein
VSFEFYLLSLRGHGGAEGVECARGRGNQSR